MRVRLESLTSPKLDTIRLQVLVVLWTFVLLISPLWYHLTFVYRAAIPFDQISDIQNFQSTVGINIGITGFEVNVDEIVPHIHYIFGSNNVNYNFQIYKSEKNSELVPGSYRIDVECGKNNRISIKSTRFIELDVQNCPKDLTASIVSTIAAIFVPEYKQALQDKKDQIRVLPYSPKYQLVFNLLVENPDDAMISWEIEKAYQEYFEGFLRRFVNVTLFEVSSQIQNYAVLPIEPVSTVVGGEAIFSFKPKDLTQFINTPEWNFASVVSNSPSIQFVLYIPCKSQSPLHILDSKGDRSDFDAFLIPQWGGIAIGNFKFSSKNEQLISIDLAPFLEIFAEQLRMLMGVNSISKQKLKSLLPDFLIEIETDMYGLSDWELDRLLRNTAVKNIKNSIGTLNSLSSLLQSLNTIVVQDHISDLVSSSMNSLHMAADYLRDTKITFASLQAKEAIVMAERAFFDPTMVALLYFPAEHLLAIYMPFFIPIALPMITTLFKEIKQWKKGKSKLKAE